MIDLDIAHVDCRRSTTTDDLPCAVSGEEKPKSGAEDENHWMQGFLGVPGLGEDGD